MPEIRPFRAIFPTKDFLDRIPSKSEEYASVQDMRDEMDQNPHTYLHMTKGHLRQIGAFQDPAKLIPFARSYAESLIKDGAVLQEELPSFYIYRQTYQGHSYTGLIGLASILDYQKSRIKKHEHTREEREKYISKLIETSGIIGEPVLLAHESDEFILQMLESYTNSHPSDGSYEKSGRKNEFWRVHDEMILSELQKEYERIPDFYIMDGHHRIASVSNLYDAYPDEKHSHVVSLIFDSSQLNIEPFHRVIEGTSLNTNELKSQLNVKFTLEASEGIPDALMKGEMIMLHQGECLFLKLREAVPQLDVQVFEEYIQKPIFGVVDARKDGRIDFIPGNVGPNGMLKLAQENPKKVYFLLSPCTFDEIKNIADNHEVMPPKSTSVQPKGRAGLLMQSYGKNGLEQLFS
jgi:uncharacterized protein (DUF1015 family)